MQKLIVYLTGEGKSDIGYRDYATGEFVPREMTHLAMAVLRKQLSDAVETEQRFLSESELSALVRSSERSKRQPVLTARLTLESSKESKFPGLWFRASIFAEHAKKDVVEGGAKRAAILFTDADGTHSKPSQLWRAKFEAILNGFTEVGFTSGIPMVPQPKSEAWLLGYYQKNMGNGHCAYQNCERFEKLAGNDDAHPKNSAKHILDGLLEGAIPDSAELLAVEWERVKMPSLEQFISRMHEVVGTLIANV